MILNAPAAKQLAAPAAAGDFGRSAAEELMFTRFCVLMVTTGLVVVGVQVSAPAVEVEAVGPVLVVVASYPGANASAVADIVAAPIEQKIADIEGLIRIESESVSNGNFTAHLYFKPNTDPEVAVKLVQNRVALAMPLLPEKVRENEVSVTLWNMKADPNEVAIAVIDSQGHGWEALQIAATAVVKQIAAEGALIKPKLFPQDVKQVSVEIDRVKCTELGVSVADVSRAVLAAGPAAKIENLRKLVVHEMVSLSEVAALKEVTVPDGVYRVNLHLAIRITSVPPVGKSPATVASRCIALAEAEIKRLNDRSFKVENLSAKQRH